MVGNTYTMPELAERIGVPVKVVSNAKYSKNKPRPGSKIHLVTEKMDEMGITWDQVVSAPKGGYKGRRKPLPVDAPRAAPEPDPVEGGSITIRPSEQREPEMNDANDCCANDDCDTSNHCGSSVDRPIHLEDAIAAMRLHLPGASITITIE